MSCNTEGVHKREKEKKNIPEERVMTFWGSAESKPTLLLFITAVQAAHQLAGTETFGNNTLSPITRKRGDI